VIAQKTSEPHHHESNYVERSWQTVKQTAFNVTPEAVVPVTHTFAILAHICDFFNHLAIAINGRTPLEILTGDTQDISVFHFKPYEPAWFLNTKATLQHCEWVKGRFLGIAWSTGDQMFYRVVPDGSAKMQRVVHQSGVLPRHPDENIPREIINHLSDYFFPTPTPSKQADIRAEAGDKHTRDSTTHELRGAKKPQTPTAGTWTSESL
jgi:hypothetical protein